MTPPDLPRYHMRLIQSLFTLWTIEAVESADGEWLKWADHAAYCAHLQQQIDELKRAVLSSQQLAMMCGTDADRWIEQVAALRLQNAELVTALKTCSFQLATLIAAHREFNHVNAQTLDAATAALAKAEAKELP